MIVSTDFDSNQIKDKEQSPANNFKSKHNIRSTPLELF